MVASLIGKTLLSFPTHVLQIGSISYLTENLTSKHNAKERVLCENEHAMVKYTYTCKIKIHFDAKQQPK